VKELVSLGAEFGGDDAISCDGAFPDEPRYQISRVIREERLNKVQCGWYVIAAPHLSGSNAGNQN
jgi:hypothetical protein